LLAFGLTFIVDVPPLTATLLFSSFWCRIGYS